MKTDSISGLLKATQLALSGLTEDKELQKQMSTYGFTSKKTQEGQNILGRVQAVTSTREQKAMAMRRLSSQITQDGKTVLNAFRDHASIARAAFRQDPLALRELKISKLNQGTWSWVQQALDFYEQTPLHMAKLQQFGAVPEAFQQNQAAAQALFAMRARRLNQKGKAEHHTQEKHQAIRELRAWYGDFRRLARVAFRESPQLLETFGIVVRSKPRKRKPAAEVPVNEEQA